MSMCLTLHSVSDENIENILARPVLIWKVVAADDPDAFETFAKKAEKPGLFAKLFGRPSPNAAQSIDLNFIDGELAEEDLDQAWHGIHYCLTKTDFAAEPPLDFLTVGGDPSGDEEVGYGPARLFKSDVVREIHTLLSGLTAADLHENYYPEEMDDLNIYPSIWTRDGEDAFVYIAEYFETLKNFLEHCVGQNLGMSVCMR